MLVGIIPLAIAAIGASYAWLVLKGARSRDNLMFGALALVDAAMTAWRGINVLAGGSIVATRVLVFCTIGTVALALLTLEFLTAFPRRKPMARGLRFVMLAWGAVGLVTACRSAMAQWMRTPWSELTFFLPATVMIMVVGVFAWRAVGRVDVSAGSRRAARTVIGMLMFRWAFGFVTYFVGPLIGRFEELVWAETTFASLVGFVVVGTSVLRTELFSMKQAATEVVTIATVALLVICGGGAAVAAALYFVPPGDFQHVALFVAAFVPLHLAALGKRLYPRLERRVLAQIDERRARRMGVQGEPLPFAADAAIAEALHRIATIGDGATVCWQLAAALPTGTAARLVGGSPLRRDEEPDLFACLVVPAIGGDGSVLGAILVDGGTLDRDTYLVARELAARIALVVERAQALTALEDARRLAALGQFAAAIAHDIRTPLTSISLNVQIIRRKLAMSPDDAEHLDIALEELARLDRSVAEILDFAKPVRLATEAIDVRELIDTTTRGMSPVLLEKGVAVRCEQAATGAATLPVVHGDRQRLRQVLVNLVDNAADASTPGAEITVRAGHSEGGIAIEVEDRGRGIEAADLARIFEPFFTTRSDGTGLGLAIVHKVVEAHGGRMEVRSRVGQGSTFTIVLPT